MAVVSTGTIGQMQRSFPGVIFFKEYHNTLRSKFARCGHAATAMKCTKWHDACGTIAFLTFSLLSPSWTVLVGNLSNHEGDRGGENVTHKVNSCCFKFHHTNLVASRHIKDKKAHFRLTCVAKKTSLLKVPDVSRFSKIQLVVYYQCCVLIG